LTGHTDTILVLAALSGNFLASGSKEQHTGAVYCLAKLLNGNLASGSWDNQVIIWDATNSFSMSLKLLYFFSIRLIHVKLKKKVYHKFLRHILILYGQ